VAGSGIVIETLKRELKARGMTYAQLAPLIKMSEAGVKRMFAARNFTLERLDQICEALGTNFVELTRRLAPEEKLITELSWKQEEEIVADKKLFTVAVCALNLMSFEQITAIYAISSAECVRCLTRLDKIGFLQLQPLNRVRLLVARTFQWIPHGPIARYIKGQASDYFDDPFDGPGEVMRIVNVRVSREAKVSLLARLQQVAREYSEQHNIDARLPLGQRYPISLLFAVRPWEPPFMRSLRRMNDDQLYAYLKGDGKEKVKQADRPDPVVADRHEPEPQRQPFL
jgi:DNA-binding Xre family transcriptional regulator